MLRIVALAAFIALIVGLLLYKSGYSFVPASKTRTASAPLRTDSDPVQIDLEPGAVEPIPLERDDFELELHPVAEYTISGRVVSRFAYHLSLSRGATAPVDLAIAWGDLLEGDKLRHLEFENQRNGFVFVRAARGAPFGYEIVKGLFSNNHCIPASANVKRALTKIDVGDRVSLSGYLVDIDGKRDGRPWRWKTSRVRTDDRGGACELLYVKSVRIGNAIYE